MIDFDTNYQDNINSLDDNETNILDKNPPEFSSLKFRGYTEACEAYLCFISNSPNNSGQTCTGCLTITMVINRTMT